MAEEIVYGYDKGVMFDTIIPHPNKERVALVADPERSDKQAIYCERSLINHASCSYLGFHAHPRVIEVAKEALDKNGFHYSASRAYSSLAQYLQIERLMNKVYDGKSTLLVPSTSYGHMAYFGAIIGARDLIILDKTVHASVHTAAKMCKGAGTRVIVMDLAAENFATVQALQQIVLKHLAEHSSPDNKAQVYICMDGVYSMKGKCVDVDFVHQLTELPNTTVYVDDAHGMSLDGDMGQGIFYCRYTRKYFSLPDNVVLALSLSKGFGCAGGLLVLPYPSIHKRILCSPTPIMFGGPLSAPGLAATMQVAEIHASRNGELKALQQMLQNNIQLAVQLLTAQGVNLYCHSEDFKIPILYICVAKTEAAYELTAQLRLQGVYVSPVMHPVVPKGTSGIRFTITARHTDMDIATSVSQIATAIRSLGLKTISPSVVATSKL